MVRQSYDEAIKLHPTAPSDLKIALRSHERIPLFVDNLARQFTLIAEQRTKKAQPLPSMKHLKEIVCDMVDVFIAGVKDEALKRQESDMKKMIRETEARNAKDLDASASGELTGDYADLATEAGLIIDESRSV